MVIKSNFSILLVLNYHVFQITIIYINIIHPYLEDLLIWN